MSDKWRDTACSYLEGISAHSRWSAQRHHRVGARGNPYPEGIEARLVGPAIRGVAILRDRMSIWFFLPVVVVVALH